MSPSNFLSALILGLLVPLGARAQEPEAAGDPVQAAAESQELAEWRALLARDKRLRFTPRTGEVARQELDSGFLNEEQRAAALFALGAGREARERPRLEASVLVGTLLERRAALLGMGELGLRVDALLGEELFDPEVAAYAFLALVRRGGVGARRLTGDLSRNASAEIREAVDGLFTFVNQPARSRPTEAARAYLELRWEAAGAYGLVDGKAWSTIVLEELLTDPDFLNQAVYIAAADLDRPGVTDHLVNALITGESPAVVRACVRAMPSELAQLVDAALWAPKGIAGWELILEEIDREGLESSSVELLEQARQIPEVHVRALALLARAGINDGLEQLSRDWATLSTDERVEACEAWGNSGLEEALPWLVGRLKDPSERVRAAVWIARARLLDDEAREHVESVLGDPTDERWDDWLRVALSQVQDRWIGDILDAQLDYVDGPERVAIASTLALGGRLTPLDWLRPELREGLPEGELTLLGLRAITRRGSGEDMQQLARLFPFEGETALATEINAVIARAMIEDRNVLALPILQGAIWADPFDRSVLAALLMVEVAGMHALREEVLHAEIDVSERDFRRVGFALGEWGGLAQLEILRTRGRLQPGDPVLQGVFLGAMAARTQ